MATKREEAQKRRAEERRKRRESGSSGSDEATQDGSGTEEPLDTVKHAAKVAAAAAAVGAAMGAARAMTGSGGDHDEAQEAPPEREEPAEPEADEPRAEQEEPREPRAEAPAEPAEPEQAEEPEEERRPSGARPDEAKRVVSAAREQLAALLGKQADAVSGLERTDHGWVVTLDVVELARIPESTDVLASYDLELDEDRNLVRYSRGRRFYRSEADNGERP